MRGQIAAGFEAVESREAKVGDIHIKSGDDYMLCEDHLRVPCTDHPKETRIAGENPEASYFGVAERVEEPFRNQSVPHGWSRCALGVTRRVPRPYATHQPLTHGYH